MRPVVSRPLTIRGVAFGGPKALFCVPLVAKDLSELRAQAETSHGLGPDVIEWRADSFVDLTESSVVEALGQLRQVIDDDLLIFTLRIKAEGGKNDMTQDARSTIMNAALRSGFVDLIDVEMLNGPEFLEPIILSAHANNARVILSFHNFEGTPDSETLCEKLASMIQQGADIAKIACMPQCPNDVLRLLQVTLRTRESFPDVPLCTMSMGSLGCVTRVAGFLYGTDMAFAVGQETSAPGQIPLADARSITDLVLRYA